MPLKRFIRRLVSRRRRPANAPTSSASPPRTLQKRLILLIIIILLVPTLVIQNVLFYLTLKDFSDRQIASGITTDLRAASNQLNVFLNQIESTAGLICKDEAVAALAQAAAAETPEGRIQAFHNAVRKYRSGFGEPSIALSLLTADQVLTGEAGSRIVPPDAREPFRLLAGARRPVGQPIWTDAPFMQNLTGDISESIHLIKSIDAAEPGAYLIASIPKYVMERILFSHVAANQTLLIMTQAGESVLAIRMLPLDLRLLDSRSFDVFGRGQDTLTIDGRIYFLNYTTLPINHWSVVCVTDPVLLYQPFYEVYRSYTLIAFVLSLLLMASIFCIVPRTLRPLKDLYDNMNTVIQGNLDTRLPVKNKDEIGFLTEQYNIMLDSIQELVDTIYREQTEKRLAEMALLQNQINPHFLYNTLAAARYLNLSGKTADVDLVIRSTTIILRNTLSNRDLLLKLHEEVEIVRQYLEIQKVLMDKPFVYELDIDETAGEYPVPKFMLQPIAENCFLHGFAGKQQLCRLRIRIRRSDDHLRIRIVDNGSGTPETVQIKSNAATELGSQHIGLTNIDRRLRLLYGNDYRFAFWSKQNLGSIIMIDLNRIQTDIR